MPSIQWPSRRRSGIVKFTNCRLIKGDTVINEDLWISTTTGKIIHSQVAFFDYQATPDEIIDLGGKLLAPGFIDVQLNGFGGFSYSQTTDDVTDYIKGLRKCNRDLIETGVTSYLPTLPSNNGELYHQVLQYLGPTGRTRDPTVGAESLGAHIEGPFLSPTKNGIHRHDVLQEAPQGIKDMEACYGVENLKRDGTVAMITLAPEVPGVGAAIPDLVDRNIVVALGHSEASYETTCAALDGGASMLTHLFNAMRPLHHRNPGMFGTLAQGHSASPTGTSSPSSVRRPYFGIIADGEHLHPTAVHIAFHAHPEGCILVTDAMHPAGCPDGTYPWTNGDAFVKSGRHLTLAGTDTMAGCTIPLVECVNNFLNWTDASLPAAIKAVTHTPARMLGLEKQKGCLEHNADADLVVLDERIDATTGQRELVVDQAWKFGTKVFDRSQPEHQQPLTTPVPASVTIVTPEIIKDVPTVNIKRDSGVEVRA